MEFTLNLSNNTDLESTPPGKLFSESRRAQLLSSEDFYYCTLNSMYCTTSRGEGAAMARSARFGSFSGTAGMIGTGAARAKVPAREEGGRADKKTAWGPPMTEYDHRFLLLPKSPNRRSHDNPGCSRKPLTESTSTALLDTHPLGIMESTRP